MVLDIDETALSAYIGTTGGDPGGGSAGQLPELTGQARALAPVKDLYDYAVAHGVGVSFITGRIASIQQQTTEANLDSEGYTQRIGIVFRPSLNDDSATYKRDARAALQQQGYTILLNVGDQCSDLFGGNAERAFKLPNTFYFTTDAPGSVDPRCDKLGAGGEVPTS
jgi:predicted secreted acid phosphatase